MLSLLFSWTWFHYVVDGDKVLCLTCKQAADEKKLVATNSEPAYIKNGYSNWRDAVLNFTKHENSICQIDAVLKMVTTPKRMDDVRELLWKEKVLQFEACIIYANFQQCQSKNTQRPQERKDLPLNDDGAGKADLPNDASCT